MDMFDLLPAEKREYLNHLFQHSTDDVRRQMALRAIPGGTELFSAGDFCHNIYIILTGRMRAVDWGVADKPYHFRDFGPGDFLGEIEAFAGLKRFRISVTAEGPVRIGVIPTPVYMAWMQMDREALYSRTQVNMRRLLTQITDARRYMLLDARERMVLLLVRKYEEEGRPGAFLEIRQTREAFATDLGLSVKTVDRNLRILEELDFITTRKGGVSITWDQYQEMQKYIDQFIYGEI